MAFDKAHKEGFCLIILVVSEKERVDVVVTACAAESLESVGAGEGLEFG